MSDMQISREKLKKMFDDDEMPKAGECCVYRLIDQKGLVIYVGQSKQLQERLIQHLGNQVDFVDFGFDVVQENEMNQREAEAIVGFDSPMNTSLPANSKYMSRGAVKRALSESVSALSGNLPTAFHRRAPSGTYYNYVESSVVEEAIQQLKNYFDTWENKFLCMIDAGNYLSIRGHDLLCYGEVVASFKYTWGPLDCKKKIIVRIQENDGQEMSFEDIKEFCKKKSQ